MKRTVFTSTVMPLADPSPEDTLSLDLLQRIKKDMLAVMAIPPYLLAPEPAFSLLLEKDIIRDYDALERSLVAPMRAFNNWLGTHVYRMLDARLFRPPDKPLHSRPHRTYVRATRKRVKADRVPVKARGLVSWRHWKGRKVPDRTGYPRNSVFFVSPSAIVGYDSAVT